jgi:peroxiredoxin
LAGLRTLLKKNENVKIFAISVDPPDVSKSFAEKIASDGKGAINFPLLSDPDHKIIDTYGLRNSAYEGQKVYRIPHPAVYVIDKQGKVSWAKIESDYKQRPTNQEIRTALDSLK